MHPQNLAHYGRLFSLQDIVSYNKEQASGDGEHNLITVIMKEHHLTVQEAIDWAGKLHASTVARFNQLYREVPRWGGPVDLDVQRLIDGIARWESGNLHWSFESGRYFGKRGLEVKETRTLYLLPEAKVNGYIGPIVIEDVATRDADRSLEKTVRVPCLEQYVPCLEQC